MTETLIPCDTISKLPVLQTLEEVEILNCYPCFLLPLTQFQKDISVIRGSASDQKGEEKEGKKREGATCPADFLLCCATGRCKFKENCGDAERRERETPWGLSGKSMPEFHHSNCRENMA